MGGAGKGALGEFLRLVQQDHCRDDDDDDHRHGDVATAVFAHLHAFPYPHVGGVGSSAIGARSPRYRKPHYDSAKRPD